VTVVADTPEVIALYMMSGTIYKHPRAIDGSPVPHFLPDEWMLVDQQWLGGGALYLSLPGQWYVLMGLFADDNQRIEQWYVNLQTPYQRTRLGFDYLDQELDIVINRELSEWRWKDEVQFLDAQRRGRIPVEQAAHVRRVGEHIVGRVRTTLSPAEKDVHNTLCISSFQAASKCRRFCISSSNVPYGLMWA
jgi:Protein of unknown function (DUF402)